MLDHEMPKKRRFTGADASRAQCRDLCTLYPHPPNALHTAHPPAFAHHTHHPSASRHVRRTQPHITLHISASREAVLLIRSTRPKSNVADSFSPKKAIFGPSEDKHPKG